MFSLLSFLIFILNLTGFHAQSENVKVTLAHGYDADFHITFAMIGFTTIFLILVVFGFSVAIWNMDPGHDSIIYRMTKQRIKKDQ